MTDSAATVARGGSATTWRTATVVSVTHPGPDAAVLRLTQHDRPSFLPGQHFVLRLTADDGYTAQRSYSVASAPSDPDLEFWVQRLADGEVSPFLADEVRPGDDLELRGPIGGWFVWDGRAPAVAIGGGSGAVPLVSMLRHARAVGATARLKLAAAAATWRDVPLAGELRDGGAVIALSREEHDGRPAGRLTAGELQTLLTPGATYYVCGSAAFAESVSHRLEDLGVPAPAIRVERFGPS